MKITLRALLAAAPLVAASSAFAATGDWSADTAGNWSDTTKWTSGIVADGADFTATFANDITADRNVTLDANRTIGNITFGDAATGTAGGWTLSGTNVLTLDVTSGASTITVNALGTGKVATISSVIAGNDGLTKAGTGTLVLNGANTYTGGTTVNAGVLRIGNAAALGSTTAAATVSSGATFDVGGQDGARNALTISGTGSTGQGAIYNSAGAEGSVGNITLAGNATIGSNGQKLNLRGTVSGANTLTIAAGGLVDLRVDAFQPGVAGVIVNGGLVAEANQGVNGIYTINSTGVFAGYANRTIGGAITLNGGTLVANDGASGTNATTFSGPITLVANSTIGSTAYGFGAGAAGGANIIINGAISGNFGLTFGGNKTTTLAVANSYTGGTTVTGGVLKIGNAASLGSTTAAATVNSGATFDVGGQNNARNVLTISGAGTTGQGAIYNSGGAEGSVGNIILAGNATIGSNGQKLNLQGTVSGANTLTIGAGVVDLRVDAFQPGVVGVIVNGGLVAEANQGVNGNYTVNSGGAIAGYANRTIGGAIALNGGALVANDGASGTNATTFSGAITLLANSTIGSTALGYGANAAGGANINITNAISGNFGLTFGGIKTTTLSAANTYTGNTTITGGTLKISSTGAIKVGAAAGGVTIASGAILAIDGKLTLTSGAFAGAIANAGTINLASGSSILDLSGLFDGQTNGSTYQLISGAGTTTGNFSSIIGYTPGTVSFNNANGLLTFTAVPEPSTYGLLGAAALAAAALVRRRRKAAGKAA